MLTLALLALGLGLGLPLAMAAANFCPVVGADYEADGSMIKVTASNSSSSWQCTGTLYKPETFYCKIVRQQKVK